MTTKTGLALVARFIILLLITLVLAFLAASFFGDIYERLFPTAVAGSFFPKDFIGLPPSYIFFATFFFTAFWHIKKRLTISLLLLPGAIVAFFDLERIYLPIIIGLIGWLLGLGINKLIYRNKNQTSIKDT